jgi:hypothetical protein
MPDLQKAGFWKIRELNHSTAFHICYFDLATFVWFLQVNTFKFVQHDFASFLSKSFCQQPRYEFEKLKKDPFRVPCFINFRLFQQAFRRRNLMKSKRHKLVQLLKRLFRTKSELVPGV